MDLAGFPLEHQILWRAVATVAIVMLLTLGRRIAVRRVRGRNDALSPQKRRQLFYVRSGFNVMLALAVLLIWLGQVQNILLSLTAVTVAIVLATKELLMCVSGFALRTGANSFSVGDWIEVDGLRGEVTDFNLLSTTLLEIDGAERCSRYTGHRVVLPNSIFLTRPVRNEKLLRHFVLHEFDIVVDRVDHAGAAVRWLEQACLERFTQFEDEARRLGAGIDQKLGIDLPGPEPVVTLHTTDTAKLVFRVLLFCPTSRAHALESDIARDFLDRFGNAVDAAPR